MISRTLRIAAMGLLLPLLSLCGNVTKESVAATLVKVDKSHPYLFGDRQTFDSLRQRAAANDPLVAPALGRLIFDADLMLALPPCERVLEGRRLLGISRQVLHRVTTLAMAFQLTGNRQYRERCAAEMLAAAGFDDWNPSHFLDVAEMTLALATGYDWLYDALDGGERTAIETAILEKGVRPSLKPRWGGYRNNWGQVCHAGMMAGALALAGKDTELASLVTHRAIEMLPISMRAFEPNGCYPEGPGYWSYGTDFNVLALAMLEQVFKADFGLTALPGFELTAQYPDLVTGPSGMTFNYADGGMGRGTDCASWWLAKRFKRPDTLAYFERDAFLRYCAARNKNQGLRGQRLFAYTLFWLEPLATDLVPQAPLCWSSGGPVPITIQRTSWDNEKALFVGLKAGSPSGPHGHMDAGSFVLDADGVRWAYDIGAEGYHRIESRGMKLWGSAQDGDRWRIFRLNNHSHNTLVIDGELQLAKGSARVVSFSDGPRSEVVLDLSPVYPNAASVIRTSALLEGNRYRLSDRVTGLRPGVTVRWAMVTRAAIDTSQAGKAILRGSGRQLTLAAEHDPAVQWRTIAIDKPRNEWDSPNKGMSMVALEATAPESGELSFAVLFTPGSSQATAE